MNIRWPLWIPATRQDALLFAALAICTAYLLLGKFQNLPILPDLSKLPTEVSEIYAWLIAITVLNFAIVLKNARNDYIFIRQQLLPCALTTLVVVTCFAAIIAYRYGVSRDMPRPDQARYLLFAEIYAFVTLNISFLFKETSSPLKDVANDVRALHRIANSKATSAEQRQQQWSALTAAAKALTSSLAKHSATLTARFDVDGTKYDLAGAAKAVGDLADKLAPEVTAKRLADRNSELSQLVRGVVANVAR